MAGRKRERELVVMVAEITENFDLTRTRGGHFRIKVWGPKGQRTVVAAGTASDHRSNHNFRADVRRMLREVQGDGRAT